MAEILPSQPNGEASHELAKLFLRFKNLDADFRVRLRLGRAEERQPDFLALLRNRFAFVVSVSRLTEPMAEAMLEERLQPLLFTSEAFSIDQFGADEERALATFLRRVNPAGAIAPGVVPLILIPNVPQSILKRISALRVLPFHILGKEPCASSEKLGDALRALAREPAVPATIEAVRARFTPEVNIPAAILPRGPRSDETGARLTRFLLDYDQENAVKMDLALTPEAQNLIGAATPRLITGVAGSGKTLVLLYRAALVTKLDRSARCLVLTHNKPLVQDLGRRLERIISEAAQKKQIECVHFARWCSRYCARDTKILSPAQRESLVRTAVEQVARAKDFPIQFLCDELEWIESYDVADLEQYLLARRVGRGRRLNEGQRRAVYAVLERYRRLLRESNSLDWPSLAPFLWKKVQRGEVRLPAFDYVFVDEAQFFAPVALKLIRSMVQPGRGQLTMAADPTQGFLKRRESWAASGLNVRGRTVRLARPYRNSASILKYAAEFYRSRVPSEDEEINLPNDTQLAMLREGPPPETITVRAVQDEVTRACNEIRSILERGAKAADILIILSDEKGRQRERILKALNKAATIMVDAQKELVSDAGRVCSINAMTGIEAPIVFILGATDLLQMEQSLKLAPEDRAELIRDNTRKLYTAMTRASQRLVVFERTGSSF